MKRTRLLALCAALTALLIPSAADAATVTRTTTATVPAEFGGQACGSVSRATTTLPRRALAPRFVDPELGELLASDEDDATPVATVTKLSLLQVDGRWVATVEATGSSDVCEDPQKYPEGWGAAEIDIVVDYSYRVPIRRCRRVKDAIPRGDNLRDAIRIRAIGTGCITARKLARLFHPAYVASDNIQPVRIGLWRCRFIRAGGLPTTCTGPDERRVTWRSTRR